MEDNKKNSGSRHTKAKNDSALPMGNIDDVLPHRTRMLLFSTLELLRKEIRPQFSDWKAADDWLFAQLDFTKGELAQVYEGRDTMYYDGSAVDFAAAQQEHDRNVQAQAVQDLGSNAGIKLEAGMVGTVKHDLDIKKVLRGKPFVVIEAGQDGFAACTIAGQSGVFSIHISQMHHVGHPSPVLGDIFNTKTIDGHAFIGVERNDVIKALEDAPIGTIITGVRDAPGSYAYGKYDFDTRIEKRGGHVQNYFAPIKTMNYETWWSIDGDTRNVYELADILMGRSRYYALTEKPNNVPLADKISAAKRSKETSPQRAVTEKNESKSR